MRVEIMGEERPRNITSNAYRRSEQRYPVQQQRCREDYQNSTKLAAMPLQNTLPESDSLQRFPMTEVRFVIQQLLGLGFFPFHNFVQFIFLSLCKPSASTTFCSKDFCRLMTHRAKNHLLLFEEPEPVSKSPLGDFFMLLTISETAIILSRSQLLPG